jgi:hypothetical protein
MATENEPRKDVDIVKLQEKSTKLSLEKENAELRARIAERSNDPSATKLEQETLKLRLQKENAELQARIAELSKDPATLKLEQETLRLRFENETSELRAKLQKQIQPWWRKSSSVATIAAIIAAILPVTTAVQGWVQKDREIALEQSKFTQNIALERERQSEQLHTAYLERLKTPGEHLRTLRFIIATKPDDDKLMRWAQAEKAEVEAHLSALEKELKEEETKRALAEKAYLDALSDADYQPPNQPDVPKRENGSQRRTARQEGKLDVLKHQVDRHEQRINEIKTEGRSVANEPKEHLERLMKQLGLPGEPQGT